MPVSERPHPQRRGGALLALMLCLMACGCGRLSFGHQFSLEQGYSLLAGTVELEEPSSSPIVIVLVREQEGELAIFDHLVLERAGPWFFGVAPGTYGVGAFADLRGDLIYQPDNPAIEPQEVGLFELGPGERVENIELVIPSRAGDASFAPIDIVGEQSPDLGDEDYESLGRHAVLGEIASLGDARFDPERARQGFDRFAETLDDMGLGIYFLEPYDPQRIPVLFVHGIFGSPREFEFLASRLDAKRFQPWFFYYPTGYALGDVGSSLGYFVSELQVRHRFPRLFVVAHSMGGLVPYVDAFVSISTRWSGYGFAEGARLLTEYGGAQYPRSWVDMAPGSRFLAGLFYGDPETREIPRGLPDHVAYSLLFGYGEDSPVGSAGDGVASVESQLRREARRESGGWVYPLREHHRKVLRSVETSGYLNRILLDARDRPAAAAAERERTAVRGPLLEP
jgi:hypothetical protein